MGLLLGCASERTPVTFDHFESVDINDKLESESYIQKTQNFLVIMDTSSTMEKRYLYEAFESSGVPTLFEVEKEILRRFNQAIPSINLNAGIRTYGFGSCQDWGFSAIRLVLGPYSKDSFTNALATIECVGGGSPLDYALDEASEDISGLKGNTALILLSDGQIDTSAMEAAFDIRDNYRKRVCIYTISLGKSSHSRMGMRRLAAISGCGFSVSAEKLGEKQGMSQFVEKIFLQKSYNSSRPERARQH